MAADAAGNDLSAIFIPASGKIAVAPFATAIPSVADGAKAKVTLASAFKALGLLTEDGGMEWTEEADGEAIELFQEGYSIPSGKAKVELKVKMAESSREKYELLRGIHYDENKHAVVDASGNPQRLVVWVEEIAKNGTVRRRACENASVSSLKEDKDERGKIKAIEVTFSFASAIGHAAGQYHEWFLTAAEVSAAGV